MNSFLKFSRRRFSSSLYHHNLTINDVPNTTSVSLGLSVFEVARVAFYMLLLVRGATHLPQYIALNKLNFRKARNNPDYLLCDQKTFQQINKK